MFLYLRILLLPRKVTNVIWDTLRYLIYVHYDKIPLGDSALLDQKWMPGAPTLQPNWAQSQQMPWILGSWWAVQRWVSVSGGAECHLKDVCSISLGVHSHKIWTCIKRVGSQWPLTEGGLRHEYKYTICSPKPYFLRRDWAINITQSFHNHFTITVGSLSYSIDGGGQRPFMAAPITEIQWVCCKTKSGFEVHKWPSLVTAVLPR